MAITESSPIEGAPEFRPFSERELEDLELWRAREIAEHIYSPEMMERILPFYSASDEMAGRRYDVRSKELTQMPGLSAIIEVNRTLKATRTWRY